MSPPVDARRTIHWAAQIVAAASTRLTARADFSHTNLGYEPTLGALVTHPIGEVRAGLALASLELLIVEGAAVVAEKPLEGLSLDDGLTWLGGQLDAPADAPMPLARLTHDMPAHAIADGAPFPAPNRDHATVASWFALAHDVVGHVAQQAGESASPARCWPHHFDLATLITVEAHEDPEQTKSVGFGLTPGDGGIPDPYFYVTPWPAPPPEALPPLSVGRWNTKGWTGAVLTSVDADEAYAFAREAVAACRALVDG